MLLYKFKVLVTRKLAAFWYWLMSPLAYFYSREKMENRYEKKKSEITEEQATNWIAEDITRYLLKFRTSSIDILICDYANDDHFWSNCCLNGLAPYYIKRDKTKIAFYKFKKTIEFQERIIDKLKSMNIVRVDESVEEIGNWKRIDNYQKTIIVTYRS